VNGEHVEFELLDGYVLGTLSKADAERVRAHLALCERCRTELGELQSVADVMPYALDQAPPPARLRDSILARLDEPRPAESRRPAWLVPGLAAALALALGGDVWLAILRGGQRPAVVAVVTTPAPLASTPLPVASTPLPVASTPLPVASTPRAAHSPAPRPTPAVDRAAQAALEARIARLEATLADLEHRASQRDANDRARIADLQRRLAAVRLSTVAEATSKPASAPSPLALTSAPPDPELVAALSTGHVFSVDGAIGSQAWHLTIVQPLAGKNALIYTRTPDAPAGQTYRTWVVRDGKTYDAGELPPDSVTKLEMPMPLQSGDVVAFSREQIGSGNQPTTPFLMQVTIHT
jgi:anti-sigma factor ChrR (cupin superfamily)